MAKQKQPDLFEAPKTACSYELHLHPPKYPDKLHPFTCKHEPQFKMVADARIVPSKRGGNGIEYDHMICFACGAPQGCTYGGNLLVDLQMIWDKLGAHMQIGMRIIRLRDRYARIARKLFDEKGWNGKHERIARLIDPNLTMKLSVEKVGHAEDDQYVGRMRFDESYLRAA